VIAGVLKFSQCFQLEMVGLLSLFTCRLVCHCVKLTRLGLIGLAQPEWRRTHVVFIYHAMITTEPYITGGEIGDYIRVC
jgi:hypothetical protein